jgi:hypothetical protein
VQRFLVEKVIWGLSFVANASPEFKTNARYRTGGKFVDADQKIAGTNKAHCIYIQNKAES